MEAMTQHQTESRLEETMGCKCHGATFCPDLICVDMVDDQPVFARRDSPEGKAAAELSRLREALAEKEAEVAEWIARYGRREALAEKEGEAALWKSERDRIRAYLSDGGRESLEAEIGWKRRAEAAEAKISTIIEAVQSVLSTFQRDEDQGYRSKDRQFAIDILGSALRSLNKDK